MVDFLTKDERSERMSRIRSTNTRPEKVLRSELHRLGLRFRLKNTHLPGKPDLVFRKYNAIVFVHGCFWHRHKGCPIATTPKSNTAYWQEKFERNVARDRSVVAKLRILGWLVIVAWECELQSAVRSRATAKSIAARIVNGMDRPSTSQKGSVRADLGRRPRRYT